jgi:hypothetical protein
MRLHQRGPAYSTSLKIKTSDFVHLWSLDLRFIEFVLKFQTSNFTLQTYYQYHPLNRKIYDLKLALQEKLPTEDVQALEELVDWRCRVGSGENKSAKIKWKRKKSKTQ